MPGKVEMSRGNNRQQNNNNYSSKEMTDSLDNLDQMIVSGIYHNEPLLTFLAHMQGCEVKLKMKDGSSYQGILVTVSPQCQLVLSCVHEVRRGEEDLLPLREEVLDKMMFGLDNIVTASAIPDMDSVTRRGGTAVSGFATDGEISKAKPNGDIDERSFVPWEADQDVEHHHLEASAHSPQQSTGWSVNAMFEKNREIGVVSTYQEDMSQYTTVSVDVDDGSEEFQEKMRKATSIAREIEADISSKKVLALENEDEERDLLAEYSHHRGAASPGTAQGQRFQPVTHTRNRGSDRRRGPPGNPRVDPKNVNQLTFTSSNRRGISGGFHHNSAPRSIGPQQRFSHERSPGGSAEDHDWRQVSRHKNSRRSENAVGPAGASPATQQMPHSETLPRTNRQNRDKQVISDKVRDLKEFSTSFKLVGSSGQQTGQQFQRQQVPPEGHSGQNPEAQSQDLPLAPPYPTRQQPPSQVEASNVQSSLVESSVQPGSQGMGPSESGAEYSKGPAQMSPGVQQMQGAGPRSLRQESPVNIPAQPPMLEKTPDAASVAREIDEMSTASKKQFTFNPDAPTFTPRNPQPPSPTLTPTAPMQQQTAQMPVGQPLVQGAGLPVYPPSAQSPAGSMQPTAMAVYAPGNGIVAVPSQAGAAAGYYPQPAASVGFQHPQITSYSLSYTAPPPAVPVGSVSQVTRNRRPNAPVPATATIVGQPLMATAAQQYGGSVASNQQQQQQQYQMLQHYQVGIQPGSFQPQTPLVGPAARVMQPGQYIVQQQDAQSVYGIPQAGSGSGGGVQAQGAQMVPPSSAMAHPPPSSSNNSGASHSNNASQPPTPGPQANPSPAPFPSSTPQSPHYPYYGTTTQGLYYLHMPQPNQVQYIPMTGYSAVTAQLTAASQYAAAHPGVAQIQVNPGVVPQDPALVAQQNFAQVPPPVYHSQTSNNN